MQSVDEKHGCCAIIRCLTQVMTDRSFLINKTSECLTQATTNEILSTLPKPLNNPSLPSDGDVAPTDCSSSSEIVGF